MVCIIDLYKGNDTIYQWLNIIRDTALNFLRFLSKTYFQPTIENHECVISQSKFIFTDFENKVFIISYIILNK